MLSDAFPMSVNKLQNESVASDAADGSEHAKEVVSPITPFDLSLDPSDPLAFLMNAAATESLSGDSSTDDSYASSSTTPSNRESPAMEWTNGSQDFDKKENVPATDMAWSMDVQQLLLNSLAQNMGAGYFANGIPMAPQQNMPMGFPVDPYFYTMPQTFNAFGQQPFMFNGAFPQQFPFANDPTKASNAARPETSLPSPASSSQSRRLSVTSSSSSGASLSPIVDHAQPAVSTSISAAQSPIQKDTVSDLIARVHQVAGITPAIQAKEEPAPQPSATQPAKLPIPRLQRPSLATSPQTKRKPGSPISASESADDTPSTPVPTGRTKTSHTTIERRYRTNLNARIQSLRAAVPALRVLEQKDGNRVGNLAIKSGDIDVVDERGFVDGVKVARKGSKANVLGKAVEYIRVLKRRELRLKREQDGLRALINSLENGPALLKAWEAMWLEKYGGPETDEVEGEEDNEADDENDDEDGEDDGEDDDEADGSGKKRKRPKIEGGAGKSKKAAAAPVVQQEKRKRGRPRKVPLPIPTSADTIILGNDMIGASEMVMNSTPVQQIYTQPQPQQPQRQYLLAAFAFFSFFNSPVSYYTSQHGTGFHSAHPAEHTHTGSILNPYSQEHTNVRVWSQPQITYSFGWRDVVQVLHLSVSFLLLVSIVAPWLPRVLRVPVTRFVPKALKPLLGDAFFELQARDEAEANQPPASPSLEHADERLNDALEASAKFPPQRGARILLEALELPSGLLGIATSCKRLAVGEPVKGLKRKAQEQELVVRIAELVALDASATVSARIHAALLTFTHLTVSSVPSSDLATLALVIRPIWRAKASSLWTFAAERSDDNLHVCKEYVKFVLKNMTVEEAAQRLAASTGVRFDADDRSSPLEILAREMVLECVRGEAEKVFMKDVLGDEINLDEEEQVDDENDEAVASTSTAQREKMSPATIAAGLSLGGSTADLVRMYEEVCVRGNVQSVANAIDSATTSTEGISSDITSLIRTIALYRLLFASSTPLSRVPSFTLLNQAATYGQPPASPTTPKASFASLKPDAASRSAYSKTSIPSPPPSPPLHKPSAQRLALRRCLDSAAFDRRALLEDARDRVVDLVTS